MIQGQLFQLVIDGNYLGQNVVNVFHGKVRDAFGLAPITAVNDWAGAAVAAYSQSMAKLWLDRCHVDYRIDRITCKSGVEEASVNGASIYNGGVGVVTTVGEQTQVGTAQYIQFSSSNLPRKYSRGTYWPLTRRQQITSAGDLSATGQADVTVIATAVLSWSSTFTSKWFYQVQNSATTSTDIVDIATFIPLWTAMGRRTKREAP